MSNEENKFPKFRMLDTVRVTAPHLLMFDKVGKVTGLVVGSVAPYKVEFEGGQVQRLTGDELTLAPSAATALDEMDAESAPCITAEQWAKAVAPDPVSAPSHYRSHPSGIECIQVTEHMGFNLGSATKYLWRCDLKENAIQDLEKAVWYIQREIAKRKSAQ